MKYIFSIPGQAFSVNSYRYKGFHKTKEAREYESRILNELEEHKHLIDMADSWRELGGVFKIRVNCTYPKHIFINGSGQISAKTLDVDNVLKPLIDLIITKFMGISDRFVIECSSTKSIGANYSIQIDVELLPT